MLCRLFHMVQGENKTALAGGKSEPVQASECLPGGFGGAEAPGFEKREGGFKCLVFFLT